MGSVYLCSYRPLIQNKAGEEAVANYNLPPYIDSSIRREPDFESKYPSISALCRAGLFTPRLRVNDEVVYITRKQRYSGMKISAWRLTAILQVIERFDSHEAASHWYRERDLPLPSNCMVKGNPPMPLEKTARLWESIREWDLGYSARARKYGDFLACRTVFMDLNSPPTITDTMMFEAFGRIPGTQNPCKVTSEQYDKLKQLCGVS